MDTGQRFLNLNTLTSEDENRGQGRQGHSPQLWLLLGHLRSSDTRREVMNQSRRSGQDGPTSYLSAHPGRAFFCGSQVPLGASCHSKIGHGHSRSILSICPSPHPTRPSGVEDHTRQEGTPGSLLMPRDQKRVKQTSGTIISGQRRMCLN